MFMDSTRKRVCDRDLPSRFEDMNTGLDPLQVSSCPHNKHWKDTFWTHLDISQTETYPF